MEEKEGLQKVSQEENSQNQQHPLSALPQAVMKVPGKVWQDLANNKRQENEARE